MTDKNKSREEKFKYFGSIGRIAIIFFLGFSLFLVVSTIMLIFLTKPEREVVIPDVEGKQFLEVYNSLVRRGVKPEIKFKDIADIDDGTILSQYPKKGKVVPENSRIKLTVSRSEFYIDVPNLVGKELPLALNNLKNIHRHDRTLSLGTGVISYIPSNTVTDNIVIDQSPRAGEKVTPDRKINILVSSGKIAPDAVMPDVRGQSIELCYDLLRAKGLTVAEEIVATDDITKSGLVISQTPAKGTAVQKGDTCTVQVSYNKLDKHPYAAYEKIEFQIPGDEKQGLYEAYVEDGHSKRIRFSKKAGPGQKILFIFRRQGNATITFRCDKKRIDDMTINVD
jgi:eukaryotic-like serine/threonine-protein kinase